MAKRLLYIVNDADYFVSHRLELAKSAQKNGYIVSVATRGGEDNPEIKNAGLTCYNIPITRGQSSAWLEIKTLWSIYKLLRKNHFDLVHVITLKATILSGLAGRLARQKNMLFALTGLGYVFTENTPRMENFRKLFFPFLRFAMNGRNYRSIFQNPDDMLLFEDLRLIPDGHGFLIKGSGVDTTFFIPMEEPEEPITVLFPARLLGHKGLHEFITAARHFKGKAKFILAGGVDPQNPSAVSQDYIEKWQNEHIIEWIGKIDDIRKALSQCHIVCLPSYREGLPKSLIEAAACGKPIVTTDIPGCREIVKDGANGFLVPSKEPEPLIDALETLIHNQNMRTSMGQKGRELVEESLSLEIVINETLKAYKETYD